MVLTLGTQNMIHKKKIGKSDLTKIADFTLLLKIVRRIKSC